MNFRDYFAAEMRLLREAGQVFAAAYPEQAGRLHLDSLHDNDPYIERLLEGFAFLTGQIRQRMDNELPDLANHLLQQLWPQLLTPFPAVTILEFNATKNLLPKSLIIPRGTTAHSQAVGEERTSCKFVTTSSVVLNPLRLSQFQIQEAVGGGSLIRVYFQCDQALALSQLDLKQIRCYLYADPALALELYWVLTTQVQSVHLNTAGQRENITHKIQIEGANLNLEDTLLPRCDRMFQGFHLLQEYFICREKYLFINLHGLENCAWPMMVHDFMLDIHVTHHFPDAFQKTIIPMRLHCTPAVNLFLHASEPIRVTQAQYEYPITPDLTKPMSIVLHTVTSIGGRSYNNGEQHLFVPWYAFRHRDTNNRTYQLQWKDVGKENPQLYVSFSDNQQFSSYDMSCQLLVSNGHYPRQYLREGMLTNLRDMPHSIKVTNITRPTAFYSPPRYESYLWLLMQCMSFNSHLLTNQKSLQDLLHLFEWTKREEQQKKLQAIYEVKWCPCDKIFQGAIWRGVEVQLSIYEDAFISFADIYLFGNIMQQFFRMYAAINCFVQTKIICHPSQRKLLWQQQLGQNPPL